MQLAVRSLSIMIMINYLKDVGLHNFFTRRQARSASHSPVGRKAHPSSNACFRLIS